MTVRLNAIGLVAADLERTIPFYERLGCTFEVDPDGTHADADLGGFRLMLDSAESAAESGLAGDDGPLTGHRPGFALAAQLDTPAEVDALFAELDAAGQGVNQPFDAPWGMRYATVTDPDGTKVDLYAWLPGQGPGA